MCAKRPAVRDSDTSESESSGYTPPAPEKPRPCGHNQWMKQTKKKGKLVLKCAVCGRIWKIVPENHEKCKDFHRRECKKGDECERPHIYARKEYLVAIKEKNEQLAEKKRRRQQTHSNGLKPLLEKPFSTFAAPDLEHLPTEPRSWRHDPYSFGSPKVMEK
eukprot:TRINITY_DN31807_c0_g1_i1.p1 TRINITY_DN31807_c0_g1~~TRINITY_DN31807_c0_g1_i1.p1  ORF type:complete len:161 (+),score=14.98 TRINITY_DN31807_c0_g1_i1:102-584(+)